MHKTIICRIEMWSNLPKKMFPLLISCLSYFCAWSLRWPEFGLFDTTFEPFLHIFKWKVTICDMQAHCVHLRLFFKPFALLFSPGVNSMVLVTKSFDYLGDCFICYSSKSFYLCLSLSPCLSCLCPRPLINCQKGEMCLRQLWSILWRCWNQRSLTQSVTMSLIVQS